MNFLKKLIIISIMPIAYAFAHSNGWHMMNWGHMNYGTGGFIMFAIVLLILIGGVVYFVINRDKLKQNYEEESALGILKMRYAKGEITKQQYEAMKKEIE